MSAPTLSALIVNWNTGDLLGRCLDSLPAAAGDLTFEAIVVDNASHDDSLESLPSAPWLRVVRRDDNIGFAAGTNQAAALARGRQLLLLNPDTECRPGALSVLSAYLDAQSDVGAVGPRLLHTDGRIQRSCWRGFPGVGSAMVDALYLWKLPRLPLVRGSEVQSEGAASVVVDHLLGACMLIPRTVWDAVGPLDAGYFLFLEETDWCRRARQAGHRIVYLPAAVVLHHGEHSVYQVASRSIPQYYQSLVRYVRRDGAGRTRLAALKGTILIGAAVRQLLWAWRQQGVRANLARDMRRGYGRVMAEVAWY